MRSRVVHLGVASVLFIVEAVIAVTATGNFVRHTLGDFLVVILIYCLLMGILQLESWQAGAITLAFAFAVEFAQAWRPVDRLGLDRSTVTDLTVGSTFAWSDIAAYTLGVATALTVDSVSSRRRSKTSA